MSTSAQAGAAPPHQPLGIRINNPGNIRASRQVWQGMAADQSKGDGFVVFLDAVSGLRAMARVLINYRRLHGFTTARQIVGGIGTPGQPGYIPGYAPPTENDTKAYIAFMCDAKGGGLGLDPDAPIDMQVPATLARWMPRQILRELGQNPYSVAEIATAIARALA